MKYLIFLKNSLIFLENREIFEFYCDFLLIVLKIADFTKKNCFFSENDEISDFLWKQRFSLEKHEKIQQFYEKKPENPDKFLIDFLEKLIKNPLFSKEFLCEKSEKSQFFLMNFYELFIGFTKRISSVKTLKFARKTVLFYEQVPIFSLCF